LFLYFPQGHAGPGLAVARLTGFRSQEPFSLSFTVLFLGVGSFCTRAKRAGAKLPEPASDCNLEVWRGTGSASGRPAGPFDGNAEHGFR
jgi:hypothetical protein